MTRQGFELQFDAHAEEVNESDQFGRTLLDLVYQGGTHHLMFESKIYKAGSTVPFWPWGALGVIATTAAPIGRLGSAVAASTVLTATANTPAASTPATLTASKSILAPNSSLKLLFDSRVRHVPIRLVCLPSETTGTVTAFTTS